MAIAAAGYFAWFRGSSLVAIDEVEVVGVVGPEREAIVAELTRLGEEMTTLHPDRERLEAAALAFPTVSAIEIDPNFPHGLRLELTERRPALLARPEGQGGEGEAIPVAGDGTALTGIALAKGVVEGLPVIEIEGAAPPAGSKLEGEPLQQALVIGAAPPPLRPLIAGIGESKENGLEATLEGGIAVRLGTAEEIGGKWAAAAAVLADPKLESATYVDVSVPERPVAG